MHQSCRKISRLSLPNMRMITKLSLRLSCHFFPDHLKADRIFLQPRNPETLVCKVLRWRRSDDIPWPAIPGDIRPNKWFIEHDWEDEDPLWRAALQLKPSIYIEDLESAAKDGTLNLDFERDYMFHTAFIHGHAHWPALDISNSSDDDPSISAERKFFGSVQPAVFDGPRLWPAEKRQLVELCLARIAPAMKACGESAPPQSSFE